MTAPECTRLLRNGQKCRATAKRGLPFCRHHDPATAAAPPRRPCTEYERFSRHRHWINISRDLPWFAPAELPAEILAIHQALLEDGSGGISDREAGRLLRGLLRRIGHVPFELPGPELPGPDSPDPDSPGPGFSYSARPAQPQLPARASLAPGLDPGLASGLAPGLDSINALVASLLGSAPQPDLPHIQPNLPHMRPDPRHIQPNLPQMRPNPNCPTANHIAPLAAASAVHAAPSAAHPAPSQMTPLQSPARVPNPRPPANR